MFWNCVKKGNIVIVDIPKKENSNHFYGKRPCVIISTDIAIKYSPIIDVVPLSSFNKPSSFQVKLEVYEGVMKESVVLIEQKQTIDKHLVEMVLDKETNQPIRVNVVGKCIPTAIEKIENAIDRYYHVADNKRKRLQTFIRYCDDELFKGLARSEYREEFGEESQEN